MLPHHMHHSYGGNIGRAVAVRRVALAAMLAALLLAVMAALVAPQQVMAATLAEKRATANRITAQVDKLDEQLSHLQERLRSSADELEDLNVRVNKASVELRQARAELALSRRRLVARLVTVYQSGATAQSLLNLTEADSYSNLVDRLETIERVSDQDAEIVGDIQQLARRVEQRKADLAEARADQAKVVLTARRNRNAIAAKVAKRRAVLNSVEADIRSMVAAQRAARAAAEAAASRRAAARAVVAPTTSQVAASPDPAGAISSASPPPASGGAAAAAGIATQFLGTPYRWGGADPSGFDCSGLVMYAFGKVGISLPHSTYALWNAGPHVARNQLQRGDLVFFSNLGHMGIYLGGGSYVHSPRTGDVVKISSMNDSYGINNYEGAVRITR